MCHKTALSKPAPMSKTSLVNTPRPNSASREKKNELRRFVVPQKLNPYLMSDCSNLTPLFVCAVYWQGMWLQSLFQGLNEGNLEVISTTLLASQRAVVWCFKLSHYCAISSAFQLETKKKDNKRQNLRNDVVPTQPSLQPAMSLTYCVF